MGKLQLFEEYTREEISNIFRPDLNFRPGTGTYGIHGLIRLDKVNEKPDFIFFVNIGQKDFGYEFTENIDKTGKLIWQSQPSQGFYSEHIKQLIDHDEESNNIHLLIRHGKKMKEYLYLGKLAYISHDKTREKPVHFKWQIIQWSQESIDKLREIGIEVSKDKLVEDSKNTSDSLQKVEPPKFKKNQLNKKIKNDNNTKSKSDYNAIQRRNSEIGELGESIVFEAEKEYLIKEGKEELAEQVNKMSDTNDKVGYDIRSFNLDGTEKFIEVKTTTGGKKLGFYISPNQIKVSEEKSDQYYIYRLFNLNEENKTANYFEIKGSIADNFELTPTEYKVSNTKYKSDEL